MPTSWLIILITMSLTSCVSTKGSKPRPQVTRKTPSMQIEKPGRKVGALVELPPTDLSNPTSQVALVEFVRRHAGAKIALSAQDRTMIDQIINGPSPQSLAAAALSLAILAEISNDGSSQPSNESSFEEQELYNSNTAAIQPIGVNSTPMSTYFTARGLSMVTCFKENTFLKTHSVFQRLQEYSVSLTGQSDPATAELNSIIAAEANRWSSLMSSSHSGESIDAIDSHSTRPITEHSTQVYFSPADLRSGDNVLMEAQDLAAAKRYSEAIAKAKIVSNQNPMFREAQDKIKTFSNEAVRELRQKAAQAFQNALPVADQQAKMAYLVEAKEYLETALQQYPMADQLDTVRENLSVISKDLSSLQTENDTERPSDQPEQNSAR